MIFITTLGIIVILAGLVLVFAQSMRTEAMASGNRLAQAKADAIEQGAEQWTLATIEANVPDAVTITQTNAEQIQVGDGYFWVLQFNGADNQNPLYGITDEAGKLNISHCSATQLMSLPNMTQDVADAIEDWRRPEAQASSDGAESSYYSTLPEPYIAKNLAFETVEELMLVKGITPDLMFGSDRNRNGVIDPAELASSTANGPSINFNGTGDATRGFYHLLTAYTTEPNATIAGSPRVNVNARNTTRLRTVLSQGLSATRAAQIVGRIQSILGIGPGLSTAFPDLGTFFKQSGMTGTEFGQVFDSLTATANKTRSGLINVNTAPQQVLACLPGLEQGDVDTLVAQRTSADLSTLAWVFNALPPDKAAGIANAVTGRSFQYSADIVAVSGDGRAFKRVLVVIDASTLPAKIIYRRDLTSAGWPLPAEIRSSLRSGSGLSLN